MRREPVRHIWSFGLNLVFPRSYERGYGARPSGAKLHVCQIPYDTGGAGLCSRANRKRCWSTALQKLLLQSFTVEAQRVGRARSPLRAGVARADPAS